MVEERGALLRGMRERVAKIVSLNDNGTVRLKPGVELPARDMVLSAYAGKHYAAAAGLANDVSIENKELVDSLSLPKGTVGRCVKELRDAHLISSVQEGRHVLLLSNLERAVAEIEHNVG
jgi:DNA-binding transcriptional ArsR family regulator